MLPDTFVYDGAVLAAVIDRFITCCDALHVTSVQFLVGRHIPQPPVSNQNAQESRRGHGPPSAPTRHGVRGLFLNRTPVSSADAESVGAARTTASNHGVIITNDATMASGSAVNSTPGPNTVSVQERSCNFSEATGALCSCPFIQMNTSFNTFPMRRVGGSGSIS